MTKRILLLSIICILSFTGGFIDCYTLLLRDGVFATMQTGNLIYLMINFASNNLSLFYFRLLPIISFILGIIVITIMRYALKGRMLRIISLIIIISSIISSSFIPLGEYNYLATSILSFASAIQLSVFSNVCSIPVTTTMCTADMRYAMENIVGFCIKKDRIYFYNFIKYFLAIISFSLGVIISYLLKGLLMVYAILIIIPLYLFILCLYIFFDIKKVNLNNHVEEL